MHSLSAETGPVINFVSIRKMRFEEYDPSTEKSACLLGTVSIKACLCTDSASCTRPKICLC